MTSDSRIESYLTTRSHEIDLPHADLERITGRARRRRHRRRATRGGIAAALLVGGIAFVAGQPDDAESVTNLAEAPAVVVPSDLEWTVAPTRTGLGWSDPLVADDGTVYALSTAANPDGGPPPPTSRVVYRSADGGEWEPVGLPDGLFASSLATDDGALYALGTTAAGGTAGPLDLAVSTDGGGTWSSTEVPFDPAAEAPDFPGTVLVEGSEVAVDGERTVVALQVRGLVDVAALLGPDDDPELWYAVETGLATQPTCPPGTGEQGPVLDPDTGELGAVLEGADGTACDPAESGEEHRSWADLGVDPAAGALVVGHTVVLAGPTGGELSRVEDVPEGSFGGVVARSLVAADDGFWFLGHQAAGGAIPGDVTVWHSADGATWTPSDLPGGGYPVGTGVVDGRAVALSSAAGSLRLHLLGQAGTAIDVNDLLDTEAGELYVNGWGFGPMGLALVVQGPGLPAHVVTSPDGVSYSVQEIPLDEMAEPGQRANVNGITVTADAVKVRVNVRADDDLSGGAPLAQQLYVGTPA